MVTLDNPAGRLLRVRFADPLSLQEMRDLGVALPRRMKELQPNRGVICADFSALKILAPDVRDAWVELAKSDNPLIERSALLLPTTHLLRLQMSRLSKEAGSPSRRAFQDPWKLYAWLSPLLDPQECRHLNAFLAEAEARNFQRAS